MTHRAAIEVGPGTVTRLCCGTAQSGAIGAAALEWIDDPVALRDEQPVATAVLWREVLAALACPQPVAVLLIHPSWWPAARVALLSQAAGETWGDVRTRARAQSLAGDAATVIEIAATLVAITTAGVTVAEPRIGPPAGVADAVVRHAAGGAVLIDAPQTVPGAPALAGLIAARLRAAGRRVDNARLAAPPQPPRTRPRKRRRRAPQLAAVVALLVAAALGISRVSAPEPADTTALIEGRITVQVPVGWPVRRVTDGPGSPRVEVTSPADPQTVLLITQALVPNPSLAAVAEALGRALAKANERGEIFVDFTPAATVAGRPAITYRELRPGKRIDWTVLVDGAVRIGIGCQCRGDAATLSEACERAVHTARVLPSQPRSGLTGGPSGIR